MKPIRICSLIVVAVAVALSSTADARKPSRPAKKWVPPAVKIPARWINVRTAAFEMALPPDFRSLGERIRNPKTPWIGAWRFATLGARAKMFVRVGPLTKQSLRELLAKSVEKLRKRASEIQTMDESQEVDEKRRDFIIGFYQATMNAKNHKTKKIEPRPHLVIRAIQQYPEVKLQSVVTYLFTSSKFEAARRFLTEQSSTLKIYDRKEDLERIQKLGAKYPRVLQSIKAHPMLKVIEAKVRLRRAQRAAQAKGKAK